MTVSGAINRDLVMNINQPVPAGYLTPGMAVLCIDTGTELRMLSYGDMEAIVSEAEEAAVAAEEARDQAANYANDALTGGMDPGISAAISIPALTIPAGVSQFMAGGYASAGDGGRAQFKKVPSAPEYPGYFQSADGAFWQISDLTLNVKQFGAAGDGISDDTDAINNAFTASWHRRARLYIPSGVYRVRMSGQEPASGRLRCLLNPGVSIVGDGALRSVIAPFGDLASDVDYMHIIPRTDGPQDFLHISDISIWPGFPNFDSTVKGRCPIWLVVDQNGVNISKFQIDGCYFTPSNDYSFRSECNPAKVFQGAPSNSLITGNSFWGGVFISNIGDSNVVEKNTVRAPVSRKRAFDVFIVNASGGYAGHNVFADNNIDCPGGAFYFWNGREVIVERNNIELSEGDGSPSQAVIDFDGFSGAILDIKVRDNHVGVFGTATAQTAIRFHNVQGGIVDGNVIKTDVSRANGLLLTAISSGIRLGHTKITGPWSSIMLDQGTDNMRVQYTSI
ncbi:glycosyl hydrolase family 28-related protein [Brucella sp. 191011898]|uniref:glycosyl hydrolase family 28-related protein n=3 Tax=unclassified Brucella TaxID=2632610 RepID=UPI00176D060A|nr:glycosyl hydrolase family 28-related protein [Brucella sp. 191011898]CAB4327644.1 hypothetical protein BCH_03066 [Brucella sp. 191011898]